MSTILNINKKTLAAIILLAGLLISLSIRQVRAAANDSSITLKKDPASGLFTLTVRDPDGIQEFSMTPVGKFPYGGGLSNCPRTFSINNVSFDQSSDFTPVMPGYVIDCANNTANLTIAPPKDGFTKSEPVIKKEEAPVTPAAQEAPKEAAKPEKKTGPLSAEDIQYPVPDLGNCQNDKECRSYCDNSQHGKECYAFAKKYNLISEKEAKEKEKEFFEVTNGPGGCNSGVSCEAYCNSADHLDECISFAEKSGYYSGDQLAEAKKFQAIAKSGKQFPGGCKDRNTCELYCNDRNHMEECLNFADETGFMPKEEIDQARKILPLMQKGETPGGCTSKEQCDKYCSDDSHSDECIAFGEKAGLISSEDAAMIKKTGGKGPGGCHSKQQCDAYCETNSDACFQWAQDNGLVSEADLAKMKNGMAKFKEQLDKIPPEVTQCLKDAAGEKNFNKMVAGEPVFDRNLEGKMKSCFNQLTSQMSKQFNTLPPEATQCIKDIIGEDGLKKLQSGESDENIDFSSLEGCFQKLQSSFGGGPGGPGGQGSGSRGNEQHGDGFTECGIVNGAVASYVCGINGNSRGMPTGAGVETTYFNECHAKQAGAQILHSGVCVRKGGPDKPCSDIAHPICGTDGNSWTNECNAKEAGAGVKHEGVCANEDRSENGNGSGQNQQPSQEQEQREYQNNQSPANYGGPGGCKTQEECNDYCAKNPDKCHGAPSSTGARTDTGIDFQYQGKDPGGECAKLGGAWDGKTCQKSSPEKSDNFQPPAQSQQIPQDYCSGFTSVPKCDYVGAPDSQNYKYCKQCFPDK